MTRIKLIALTLTLLLGAAQANATIVDFTFDGMLDGASFINFGLAADGSVTDNVDLSGATFGISGYTTSDTNGSGFSDLGSYTAVATFTFLDSSGGVLGTFTSDAATNLNFYQNCLDSSSFTCIGLANTADDSGSALEVDFEYAEGPEIEDPTAGGVVLGVRTCDGFDCFTFGLFQPVEYINSLGELISLNFNEESVTDYSVTARASVPEPAGLLILGAGLLGLGFIRRRRSMNIQSQVL